MSASQSNAAAQCGPTLTIKDTRKSTRALDAKLRPRPANHKFNAASNIVSHTLSLVKKFCNAKTYDVLPQWQSSRPVFGVALKFEAGPLGGRSVLDPERLISVDTTAVFAYITQQLAKIYPSVNSSVVNWQNVQKELIPTISKSHESYAANVKKAEDRHKNPGSKPSTHPSDESAL